MKNKSYKTAESDSSKDKYDLEYWQGEIKHAKDSREHFYNEAKESICLFQGGGRESTEFDTWQDVDKINIWWSLVNTLLPAYYSKTPEIETRLRKLSGDTTSTFFASLIEKFLQYQVDEELSFHETAIRAVTQWMVAGEACLWCRVEQEQKVRTVMTPTGPEEQEYSLPQLVLESLHYKDYLRPEVREGDVVPWQAKRAFLSKEDAERFFGKDKADELDYCWVRGEEKKHDSQRDYVSQERYGKAEVWEVWCKPSNKLYWVSCSGDFFESDDVPVEFINFFPCVSIQASTTPDSNVPIGDFTIARDLILEIEGLTTKINQNVRGIKSNCLYPKAMGGEVQRMYETDLEAIPYDALNEDVNKTIIFFPSEKYTQNAKELVMMRKESMDRLYEIIPASDLIRGQSDPRATATAEQLKSNFSGLRFSLRQKQLIRFFSDAIGLLGEISTQVFPFDEMKEIGGAKDLMPNFPSLDQQQLALMYDDISIKDYRIEITTDSMVELDERADRKERTDFMSSVSGFFQQLLPLIKEFPEMGPSFGEIIEFVMRSYRAGKELEDVFSQAFQQVSQKIAMTQQNQQGQQQDPKALEAQSRIQVAQINAQSDAQKAQMEMQKVQMEQQFKQMEMQLKLEEINVKRLEMGYKEVELGSKFQLKQMDMMSQKSKQDTELTKQQMDTEQELIKLQGQIVNGRQ